MFIFSVSGYPISRDSVMSIAYSYYTATWLCSSANANPAWNTFTAGYWYTGAPYNMGGWDTLSTCFWKLANGVIAGNSQPWSINTHTPSHAGVDCSGYVTRCWGISTGKLYTWTLPSISRQISWSDLVRGDILNCSREHVRLFDYFTNGTTEMMVYESTVSVSPGRVTHRILPISSFTDYIPRRYNLIEELPYPHPPYQDLVSASDKFQLPWIIGGLGGVGEMSWNVVAVATTVGGLPPGNDGYVGQLTQENYGTGYAYTGSSTDSNYTVEAYVWCRYNSNANDSAYRYNQLFAYFHPSPMHYLRLNADFTPARKRLCLQARNTQGTITTLKEWNYPTDFPDPGKSGWHHFRLSILDGYMKVWFDGTKLSDPTGSYSGFTTGYVACSQYSNVAGAQIGWFDELKVYPTRMTLDSATSITLTVGQSTTLKLIGGIPTQLWMVSTTDIVSLNTTVGPQVVVSACHPGQVVLTAQDTYWAQSVSVIITVLPPATVAPLFNETDGLIRDKQNHRILWDNF
ncbi:MAG: hypothetical protein N3A72_01730 [bacterium]|nr:hypothetical protein [bacterium]